METQQKQSPQNKKRSYQKIGQPIGRGQYGTVYAVQSQDNKMYALKEISKQIFKKKPHMKKLFANEIKIMKQINHSKILKCYDVYSSDEDDKVCLILDYCEGGNLQNFLYENYVQGVGEIKALQYIFEIISGYSILYSNNVLHRDIKLSNILIKDNQLVIGDFGFAKINAQKSNEKLGTLLYMAPEIINSKKKYYDCKADMWSIGICFYELLFGVFPFDGANYKDILLEQQRFSGSQLRIRGQRPSILVECLLRQMLTYDPECRISFEELFQHPLINLYQVDKKQNLQKNQNQFLTNILLQKNQSLQDYKIINYQTFSSLVDTQNKIKNLQQKNKQNFLQYLQNIIIYLVDTLKSLQKTLDIIRQPLLNYWLSICNLLIAKKLINYQELIQNTYNYEQISNEQQKFLSDIEEISYQYFLEAQQLDQESNKNQQL